MISMVDIGLVALSSLASGMNVGGEMIDGARFLPTWNIQAWVWLDSFFFGFIWICCSVRFAYCRCIDAVGVARVGSQKVFAKVSGGRRGRGRDGCTIAC